MDQDKSKYKTRPNVNDIPAIIEARKRHRGDLSAKIDQPISYKPTWKMFYDIAEKINTTNETYTGFIDRCVSNSLYGQVGDAATSQPFRWLRRLWPTVRKVAVLLKKGSSNTNNNQRK